MRILFLAGAVLGAFLGHASARMLLRRRWGFPVPTEELGSARVWTWSFLLTGGAFLVPLLREDFWLLLPIAGAAAGSFLVGVLLGKRSQNILLGNIVAVAGLTLTAPAAYYVSTGVLNSVAWRLYLLNVLFFVSGVLYVHLKMKAASTRVERFAWAQKLSLGKLNLLYHLIVVCVVAALVATNATPAVALLAFVPMGAHIVVGIARLSRRVKFKTLGFLLLAHSVLFCLMLGSSSSWTQ